MTAEPPPPIPAGQARRVAAELLDELVAAIPHTPSPRWWRDARCADADRDMFVPDRHGPVASEALAYCAACPVRVDCGIDHAGEEYGVWGGQGRKGRQVVRHAIFAATGVWVTVMGEHDHVLTCGPRPPESGGN